jgi:hypothetical protein
MGPPAKRTRVLPPRSLADNNPEQLALELDIFPDNNHSDEEEEGKGSYLYPDPTASQLGW